MMENDERKRHENTSSSYLSLKAELLRKKQDLHKSSVSGSSEPSSSVILDNLQSSSSSLKLKTNAELDVEVTNPSKKKKKEADKTVSSPPPAVASSNFSREDEIAFAKSRSILEAKAKLYAEIMSNNEMKVLAEDEENDKAFLVDFERKIYETNTKQSKVEYVDEFGRTRWIESDEYQRLTTTEKTQSTEKLSSKHTEQEIERVERLHREQMRSKWEAEMEELRNKTAVHYQDILFDEKREHGVGYYQFSSDDKQRAEQMATLNEMREKTKLEQMKFSQEKDQRQSIMSERLNKIRARKAKEMGIQLDGNDSKAAATEIATNVEEISTPALPKVNTEINDRPPVVNAEPEKKSQPIFVENSVTTITEPRQRSNTNPNFAYPFPVIRAGKTSESTTDSR